MFFRAVMIQAACVVVATLAAVGLTGLDQAVAALYGGAVSLANTGLLFLRHKRGERDYHGDVGRHLRAFYRSSMERFAAVGVLLALGFAVVEFAALPMLLGFVLGQIAWVAATVSFR